jgi:hypothetical protein
MAQANVPPQARQNPSPDAQTPAPEPQAPPASGATAGDATPATPKKRTHVRRDEGDREGRAATRVEQPLIDKDVRQQMDDLQKQMEKFSREYPHSPNP